jgi:hypothetical protein
MAALGASMVVCCVGCGDVVELVQRKKLMDKISKIEATRVNSSFSLSRFGFSAP